MEMEDEPSTEENHEARQDSNISENTDESATSIESLSGEQNVEISTLQEENRKLKDNLTCQICFESEADIVFLPCGHIMCCAMCSPAITKCPMCRASIRGRIKIFR